MEPVPHRPASLRIRDRDSSTGMPSTLPASISSIRRSILVSSKRLQSPPRFLRGAPAEMRSISSATTSAGNWPVSSTICSNFIGIALDHTCFTVTTQIGRKEGLRRIIGHISPENTTMKTVSEEVGFKVRFDKAEGEWKAEINL